MGISLQLTLPRGGGVMLRAGKDTWTEHHPSVGAALEIKSFIQQPKDGFKCLISGSCLPKSHTFLLCNTLWAWKHPLLGWCCLCLVGKGLWLSNKCLRNKFWAHLFLEIRWQ